MKKVLIAFSILLATTTLSAQDSFVLGLKAGFNSTKLSLSDIPSGSEIKNEAKSGFLFGAFSRIKLVGNLSFQPEFYYAKKSTNISGSDEGEDFSGTTNFNTWDLPLLAHLKVLDLKVVNIYGIAGPVISFNANTSSDLPNYKDVKTANWTFQAGGGVEFWKLTADVRYEWGMTDISKMDIGQKTDVLTFTLGYKLIGL